MVTTESPKSTAISFRRTIILGTIQVKFYKRNYLQENRSSLQPTPLNETRNTSNDLARRMRASRNVDGHPLIATNSRRTVAEVSKLVDLTAGFLTLHETLPPPWPGPFAQRE